MQKEKKNIKTLKVMVWLIAVAAVAGVALVIFLQPSGNANAQSQENQTIVLERTDITRTVSVSGVIESAMVSNVYSTQSYPVKEIFVEVGDFVKAGDVLAELDMSKLENDISQTEINLRSAITSAEEELRSNSNSITNAAISLESSQISYARQQLNTSNAERELREAEARMSEEFDSYTYDNAIADAKQTLDRKSADLENARADLDNVIKNFDDYTYQNAITDAKINLDKRRDELADAERAADSAASTAAINIGGYQSAVSAAQTVLTLKRAALASAEEALAGTDPEDEEALAAAAKAVEEAKKERDAAQSALAGANRDLSNALSGADSSNSNQGRIDSANHALKDARNSYDRAVTNLERAKSDAGETAAKSLESAENAYADAQRVYEKALVDKTRAIENNADSNSNSLQSAQRSFDDSQKQLESSSNSLRSAQNSLEQAQSRPATSGTNVEIQELNYEKLTRQLEEGKIVATADGVVTEINAKVGATPGGIMFVIEDTGNLYVSARVREHQVSAVSLGQDALITTEATGDRVYDGTVSFISPKAVSAAGSTSVEFEVRAGINNPDNATRIGMNSFLNIVLERKSGIFAVPNSAIVTNENGSFVYAVENGENREIAVSTGIRTMVNSEISGEGLYDGILLAADPQGLLSSGNESGFPQMFIGR